MKSKGKNKKDFNVLEISINKMLYEMYKNNFDDYKIIDDLWHDNNEEFLNVLDMEISSTLLGIECEIQRGKEYDFHNSLPKGHTCLCFC